VKLAMILELEVGHGYEQKRLQKRVAQAEHSRRTRQIQQTPCIVNAEIDALFHGDGFSWSGELIIKDK
jgi:hypothetical protein